MEANVTAAPGNKRPCSSTTMDEAINNNSEEVYKHTIRTTWNMANTPSMPHSHFSVFVKCQRENNVSEITKQSFFTSRTLIQERKFKKQISVEHWLPNLCKY